MVNKDQNDHVAYSCSRLGAGKFYGLIVIAYPKGKS